MNVQMSVQQPVDTGVHASMASLTATLFGFLLLGAGNVLAAADVTTYPSRLSWVAQTLGPTLLALVVVVHVEHLGYRIGRPAVGLMIVGSLCLGLSASPFIFDPSRFAEESWSNVAYSIWGSGLICLGLGLLAIIVHKERQIEAGIEQIADVGDSDESNISVHASFFSLSTGFLGFILYAAGYLQLVGLPEGTRWSWTLQLIGCLLLAVAGISHLEHLVRHIGHGALVFAVAGLLLLAVSSLPFVVNPANVGSPDWGQTFWNVWGAGALCGAAASALVMRRKWRVD